MTFLILALLCLLFFALAIRLGDLVIYAILILIGTTLLGIIVMFFNFDIGMQMTAWSIALLLVFGVLFAFSGLVSTLLFVPLLLVWTGLKSIFNKLFSR